MCSGTYGETIICGASPCINNLITWTSWSIWSTCQRFSDSCGIGQMSRRRRCRQSKSRNFVFDLICLRNSNHSSKLQRVAPVWLRNRFIRWVSTRSSVLFATRKLRQWGTSNFVLRAPFEPQKYFCFQFGNNVEILRKELCVLSSWQIQLNLRHVCWCKKNAKCNLRVRVWLGSWCNEV